MPQKIRQLKAALRRAGYRELEKRGKGSHTRWKHPRIPEPITISGHDGADAKPYQEQEVREAVRRASEEEGE